MRFDHVLISLFLAVLVLITGSVMMAEQSDVYNQPFGTEIFENVSETADEIYQDVAGDKSALELGEIEEGDAENSLFRKAWDNLGNIWSYFDYIGNLVNALAIALNINPIVVQLLLTMVIISIIITLIYLIFRFQPR